MMYQMLKRWINIFEDLNLILEKNYNLKKKWFGNCNETSRKSLVNRDK